jgi:pimeloyl-ACP methyl ester carboxylesterase
VAAETLEPTAFEVPGDGPRLSGEEMGEGPGVALLHGVTATRRYVTHGSKALPRRGFRVVSYDARAHGESEGAREGEGYSHVELAADLGRVLAARDLGSPVLAGHSMGCHTIATYALDHGDELAGVVCIGPVSLGLPAPDDVLAYWDGLGNALEQDGEEGFMRAYEAGLEVAPDWRETVLRITRERIARHRDPAALGRAVRELPRSLPFDGLAELETLDVPALVVASHDEADPTHPYSVAEAWAEALPRGTLLSEEPGESPLAWQGGKLSRAIADFCERPEVAERRA